MSGFLTFIRPGASHRSNQTLFFSRLSLSLSLSLSLAVMNMNFFFLSCVMTWERLGKETAGQRSKEKGEKKDT